jgi:hypothetical protein
MSRPLKDPKGKAEKTVNQLLGKFRILRGMADGGHITMDMFEKIEVAVNVESMKLKDAVKGYRKQAERKPFKL